MKIVEIEREELRKSFKVPHGQNLGILHGDKKGWRLANCGHGWDSQGS